MITNSGKGVPKEARIKRQQSVSIKDEIKFYKDVV